MSKKHPVDRLAARADMSLSQLGEPLGGATIGESTGLTREAYDALVLAGLLPADGRLVFYGGRFSDQTPTISEADRERIVGGLADQLRSLGRNATQGPSSTA